MTTHLSHINTNWLRQMERKSRKRVGNKFSFVCTAETCRLLTKWLLTRCQAIKANVSYAWAWCPSPLFLAVPVAAAVWEQDALHISWIQKNDLLQLLLPRGILPDLSVPGSHHASPDGRKITKVRSLPTTSLTKAVQSLHTEHYHYYPLLWRLFQIKDPASLNRRTNQESCILDLCSHSPSEISVVLGGAGLKIWLLMWVSAQEPSSFLKNCP